ncbi:MAG: hypothetical protein RBS77_06650 [Candidatus Moranbacteria bacterium]|jgi:hypothetical protein|nr:hypothetical protein [Candidatus Moranbacteria bacterium]
MNENSLESFCKKIKTLENVDAFYEAQINFAIYFSNKPSSELKGVNFLECVGSVFANENFQLTLKKVIDQYIGFRKNFDGSDGADFFEEFKKIEVKNKKLLFSALVTSTLPFAMCIEKMSEREIAAFSEGLNGMIFNLKQNLSHQYSSVDIYFVLSGVFDKAFYYQSPLLKKQKELDKSFLFRYQKASNYLISLSLRLFFKHLKFNNLFKNLEKLRRENDIHAYDICRIKKLISDNAENEKRTLGILNECYGSSDRIELFCKSFKRNRNAENVYNLIEITLSAFDRVNNFEYGVMKTLQQHKQIMSSLTEYGQSNFMAFNNIIDERNTEWSNKIYLNCVKLIGTLSGLVGAIDTAWQRNVSAKEFFNWVSNVHEVINKNDIEDDWDMVSKYLVQETNRVEWKTNFFTPSQILESEQNYSEIKSKIFKGIVKTIIGMMNTDGGVIVVGLVENPDQVINQTVKNSIIKKGGKFFYNVAEELDQNKFDLDSLKRKIQDEIKRETLRTPDDFNNLWSIESVNLKTPDGLQDIYIYMIQVKVSSDKIFSVLLQPAEITQSKIPMSKTDNFWISLLRRADGSTIYTDARKFIT